ncbi:MAG: DNA repair protein RecO C-terminal domain-containing protein [Duncaniella sp.]|nr:DNA repair protein RecO C-terminal domain-containing protein [Duncaniella sp.]MDE5672547.1 DNA repair protein RecO C-terminal domain-containing protein [Duncaniella sp.]MDE5961429.1 DNA repair protein RecO C-terminal domain-containing protein [Duncaniella sp.]
MNLHLVALRTTKYSDTQTILTAYSRELGRVSLAMPAGKGKSSVRMKALAMPLSVVECVSEPRPGREILPMRQASQGVVLKSLHSDPVKQMIAMFLSEVLAVTLQGGAPDESMFDFLVSSIGILDNADAAATANFHICFLFNLARHLGIEPDVSTYGGGSLFDMADGRWRRSMPLHRNFLSTADSEIAHKLSRMTFSNMHRFRFNRNERNAIVDGILEYYSLHYVSMRYLRSLDIVRMLL